MEAPPSLRPRRESGLGAVGGMCLCPSRGSPRSGGGDGRWGAPALHAWSRLRPRPTTQGPDPKPVAVADGVFRGPKLCRRWDPVHGAGRGEALREGETGQHPPPPQSNPPLFPCPPTTSTLGDTRSSTAEPFVRGSGKLTLPFVHLAGFLLA